MTTHLPVGAFRVGERLARQPEVALFKSKARQQLGSLGLVLVEVALLHGDRGQEHGPVWQLGACRGRRRGRSAVSTSTAGGAATNPVCCLDNCFVLYDFKVAPDRPCRATDGFKDVPPTTLCSAATCGWEPEWRMLIQASW